MSVHSERHAHDLPDGSPDPAARLRRSIRMLKTWADINPVMVPLHHEFARSLAEIDQFIETHTKEAKP